MVMQTFFHASVLSLKKNKSKNIWKLKKFFISLHRKNETINIRYSLEDTRGELLIIVDVDKSAQW